MAVPGKNPKESGTESFVTPGGIETSVSNFKGSIMGTSPFTPIYGDHKKMGTQGVPIRRAGRGGADSSGLKGNNMKKGGN